MRRSPRSTAAHLAVGSLSESALVAAILAVRTPWLIAEREAQRLLQSAEGLVGLAGMEAMDLSRCFGLRARQAAAVAAACELGRRLATSSLPPRPDCGSPDGVARVMAPLIGMGLAVEAMYCLPLDNRSRLIGQPRLCSRGDSEGTDANPRTVMRAALLAGASSCVVCHNHPGGTVEASAADIAVTRALVKAGYSVGMPVVDHVIVVRADAFTSIRKLHPELFM